MTAALAQALRRAAAGLTGERISVRTLAEASGAAAYGSMVILLAVPCLLPVPGVGTVLGTGIVALAVAMWRGHGALCLPEKVAALCMSRQWAQRVLELLATVYSVAGRLARERGGGLADAGRNALLAGVVGLMGVLIALPIPFGNVLPAASLVLIGLGLAFRDGIATALGLAVAALAVAFTGGLAVLAWHVGSRWW